MTRKQNAVAASSMSIRIMDFVRAAAFCWRSSATPSRDAQINQHDSTLGPINPKRTTAIKRSLAAPVREVQDASAHQRRYGAIRG